MAGGAMHELRERVSFLEEFVGTSQVEEGGGSVAERVGQQAQDLVEVRQILHEFTASVNERLDSMGADVAAVADLLKERIQSLEDEVVLLKRALRSSPSSSSTEQVAANVKVPDPKPFYGVRDAKELENFLWDMEQYFRAARIPDGERVSIASMYLSGDAKLWWRTRQQDDASAGRPPIATWETLKKELTDQFLPCNSAWVARDSLKKLKHSGSMREYIKEFSSLMLGIKDMSEEDKLFNFVSGLQPWAQIELRRHPVRDLSTAIAVADGLVDLRSTSSSSREEERRPADPRKTSKAGNQKKGGGKSKINSGYSEEQGPKPKLGCFICKGPHYARECPRREQVSALVAVEGTTVDVPR